MDFVNTSNIHTDSSLRQVPIDLIPIDTKGINVSWAEKTYRYAFLFDNSFKSTAYEGPEDLQRWIDIAINLQNELRDIGVSKAHKKIIEIFNDYDVRMQGPNKQRPVNFDDICTIISDKDWYQVNQESKRNLIHMITYGIFRRGYNNWAISECNTWQQKYNITLSEDDSTSRLNEKGKRRKKGFVYTNLVLRASNSVADRVQKNMTSSHGEFISVRKKNKGMYEYKAMKFNHFDGYIVKPFDSIVNVMTTQQQHLREVSKAITLGIKNGISKEVMKKHIQDIFAETFFSDSQKTSTLLLQSKLKYFDMNEIISLHFSTLSKILCDV